MFNRFNDLSFVIGLFFTIVSLIVLGNALLGSGPVGNLDLYSGLVFLVFGLLMTLIKAKKQEDPPAE